MCKICWSSSSSSSSSSRSSSSSSSASEWMWRWGEARTPNNNNNSSSNNNKSNNRNDCHLPALKNDERNWLVGLSSGDIYIRHDIHVHRNRVHECMDAYMHRC